MIRTILTFLFVAVAATGFSQQLVTETIDSQALRDNKTGLNPKREVKIYLPAGYASSNRRYPVVYYCHNIGWSPRQMIEEGSALRVINKAFENNPGRDFIFVMADYTAPGVGSLYENSSTSGRWLDFTIQELVPMIDSRFRTLASRDSRAVVGDFMGGRGALKFGMSYPNTFGVVYAMHPVATGNGSLPWTTLNIDWQKLNTAKKLEELAGPDRTAIFMSIHQAFLPNPNRPPFYCDFSIEYVNGQQKLVTDNIKKVKKEFMLDGTLDESVANLRSLRGLAFDWGQFDQTRAHVESNREFSSKLEDLGIPHQAEEFNGTPFNKLFTEDGRFVTRVIPFLNKHLVFEQETSTAQLNTTSLKNFNTAYTNGLVKGEPAISDFIDEQSRLMPEYQMTVKGKQNVLSYYNAFLKRFKVNSFTRTPSETLDLGTQVVEWGVFDLDLTQKSNGKKLELHGKYMDLWVSKNNKLVLSSQAWNYNHDIDFADQLRFSDVPITNVALSQHVPVNNRISFELAALNSLMESTIALHDGARWKMFYADDGNFLYSRHPVIFGRKSLDEFLDKHVEELPIFEKLDIRTDQIDHSGEYVIEYASHTAFVRGGEWSGIGTGKDVRIWRRGKDGSLRIFRHIGMYD